MTDELDGDLVAALPQFHVAEFNVHPIEPQGRVGRPALSAAAG